MRIISIANQKGGVGKTTTAINLSSALAHFGKKVLLVDFDPQGNAGRGLGIDINSLTQTVYDAVIGDADLSHLVKETNEENLYLLPSNLKLASLDTYFLSNNIEKPFFALREILSKIRDQYDFIIIDCPPSLGLLNINALVASDSVIIPVQCEYFAMEAVAAILASINKIKTDYNPDLRIEGFLLTMYDSRTSLGTEIAQQVRGLFKENTFSISIPRNISIPEASARGYSVTSWRPSAQGSMAYFSLAREVIDHEEN
ncbi:MAG: AAA family ATPase [Bacilli bacterium]|nr:AAA family ATPase [Bacilli bacterium]